MASIKDVHKALIMSARTSIEKEPNYTYVTARLLMDSMRSEALTFLNIQESATFSQMNDLYPQYFSQYITKGKAV